ncbi:hypothetical protein SFA35_12985 [Pseudomonas sp. HR96]|uniref:hypothetical protein n=1 Tax=Pseudomonas sp. HR96 TaxID=1027966 RepID=UPI002A755E3C|nr:hypothetical protein [Pseudomonas sp. HR96]WPO97586.1 hypothetical protein SFA35_12985 [Pseudomonas sp. HR96]
MSGIEMVMGGTMTLPSAIGIKATPKSMIIIGTYQRQKCRTGGVSKKSLFVTFACKPTGGAGRAEPVQEVGVFGCK